MVNWQLNARCVPLRMGAVWSDLFIFGAKCMECTKCRGQVEESSTLELNESIWCNSLVFGTEYYSVSIEFNWVHWVNSVLSNPREQADWHFSQSLAGEQFDWSNKADWITNWATIRRQIVRSTYKPYGLVRIAWAFVWAFAWPFPVTVVRQAGEVVL